MLPLLWRKCSTKCCQQSFGALWPPIQNSELACRIPVASGAKAVLPRYPNLCYCFGYLLSYTTHSDCKPRPSSAEACDIRAGDNLRSLSNNVLLSHVASSTIALRVVEIDLHEPYARMVASDLGECVEVFVSSGPFIDFLLDSY